MKQIIIIGADLGLNGCQILRLQKESLRLADLHKLSDLSKPKVEDLANVIKAFERISTSRYDILIAEKNYNDNEHKFKRQQHKLAQRHFRRK